MLELRTNVADSRGLVAQTLADGTPGSATRMSDGQAGFELLARGLPITLEGGVASRRDTSEARVSQPTQLANQCSFAIGLAPTFDTRGVRVGVQLRAESEATDPRCVQYRGTFRAQARLEGPPAPTRVTLAAGLATQNRGVPFFGTSPTRSQSQQLDLGVELSRTQQVATERLSLALLVSREPEAAPRRTAQRVGLAIAYGAQVVLPATPGRELDASMSAEAQITRVQGLPGQPPTQVALGVRLRVLY